MTDKNHTYETRKLAELIPYAQNSRVHSEEQINQVAASIKEFGMTVPILIDEDNSIIAGHCRYAALKKLKRTETPVIILNGLTEAQKKAYVIADNKLTDNSTFDMEILIKEMSTLKEMDFDLALTGFSEDELNGMFVEEVEGLTDEDAVPDAPEEPVSQEGDIWLLGAYYQCSDCGSEFSFEEGSQLNECPSC